MADFPTAVPSTWQRVAAIHIGGGTFSAIWGAEKGGGRIALYDEYQVPLSATAIHAEAINSRGSYYDMGIERPGSWIPVLIDLEAGGPDQRESLLRIAHEIASAGIPIQDVALDPEIGLRDIETLARLKKLDIAPGLRDFIREHANYRRDEEGKLPATGFGLVRAAGLVCGPGRSGVAISENHARSDAEGGEVYARRGGNPTTGY